ncbi:hypothetical protein [Hymenobacter sp. YC55]|uniref:hypothetical protein n=1 Tax=Hymenobacter sp. YC55 TaxID=3034019 RepID=UPI0023F9F8F8|nr:hypothetical protein [Hymenobacter sp. YC55]MDF7810828.1 hypothetical protein [Hymenobacter sp. YC55]
MKGLSEGGTKNNLLFANLHANFVTIFISFEQYRSILSTRFTAKNRKLSCSMKIENKKKRRLDSQQRNGKQNYLLLQRSIKNTICCSTLPVQEAATLRHLLPES